MKTGDDRAAPLGDPNPGYMDLPAAWRAAMAMCPYCRGAGVLDADEGCVACGGSGDLFGSMLKDAYRRGRGHVIERFRELDEARKEQIRRVIEEEPSQRQLRSAMGMGGGKDERSE